MRKSIMVVVLVSGSAVGIGALASASGMFQPDDGVRRSVVQRGHTEPAQREYEGQDGSRGMGPAVYPDEFRTIDGSGNNIDNPLWGASATGLKRLMGHEYPAPDGETPARAEGPSARLVSNEVNASPGSIPNSKGASDYLWQWGQLLDHDLSETPVGDVTMDIPVPAGDPWFDPMNTGTAVIGLARSEYEFDGDGERQQINEITAYIDASNVYGSAQQRTEVLRANDGTGMLATSPGNLLPYNTTGLPNAPTSFDSSMFVAGDIRVNEQAALAAIHTLFMREHNYWAQQMAIEFPDADGDELFQRARAIVAAEMQTITFNEFLPVLLGADAMGEYQGYDPTIEPMIANEFSAAGFRMGHTMLSPTLMRLEATDVESSYGHLPLQNAFFTPTIISDNGIDSILRGLAAQEAQAIDPYVVDDVRNMLFGPPGSGEGFDLVSLNIQRGRDHGIPHFNAIREAMGYTPYTSFAEISSDPAVVAGLESVYDSVDEIDPWVGLLAETPSPASDSMVGETLSSLLADQFNRLRHGDRFWYEAYLPADMVDMVNQQTLSVIIKRNTDIGDEFPDDAFMAVAPCPADINNDGLIDFFDLSRFLTLFTEQDPRADFDGGDGEYNFFDINDFIGHYTDGCP